MCGGVCIFFFNETATTEIYTLSLHDALPISAACVVAESHNIKNNAMLFYKPYKGIHIIPLGISDPVFPETSRTELSLDDNAIYLVSVGRLIKRKGFDTLLKALSAARRDMKQLQLMIIGDGPEKNNLKKLANNLSVSEHVLFLDSVDDEKKFKYLSVSDIYVLSSIHEGFGLVVLEAMHAGLPIISTDSGGQRRSEERRVGKECRSRWSPDH